MGVTSSQSILGWFGKCKYHMYRKNSYKLYTKRYVREILVLKGGCGVGETLPKSPSLTVLKTCLNINGIQVAIDVIQMTY